MSQDRAAFAGELSDLPVADLMRTIVRGRQTGIARFETPSGNATIWFRDGTLVDADMGRLHMEAAVERLLGVVEGNFEVELKPITRRRVIQKPTEELLGPASAGSSGLRSSATAAPSEGPGPARQSRRRRPVTAWRPTAGGEGQRRPSTPEAPAADVRPPLPRAPADRTAPSPRVFTPTTRDAPRSHASLAAGIGVTSKEAARRLDAIRTGSLISTPKVPPAPTEPESSGQPASAARTAPAPGKASPRTMAGVPMPSGALGNNPARSTRDLTDFRPAGAPSNARPNATEDDVSGPISVGTVWDAPSAVVDRASDGTSSRGTVIGIGPPPKTAPSNTEAQGAAPPPPEQTAPETPPRQTGAFHRVPEAEALRARAAAGRRKQRERASGVAQRIGLSMGGPPPEPGPPTMPDPEATSAPAVVGRYEVLLRIARGGMGTVYLCRVTGEGGFRRLFALKVIRDHLSRNEEYVDMLLQEARIASRLHHPNVVGIVDIGTLANQHYLVMDYVEGCTFSELLKVHRKSRPPHLIVPIMLDALTGLHAAHTMTDDDGTPLTLVHCDVSPQNMLVGTNGICRITDFGISKADDALDRESDVTRGKPGYLSPEQVTGKKIDHRSDVFSAGVVLWNALTGEQLFEGPTPEGTLSQVLHREIPPPSTVGLRPPSCLDRVCLRALQRDPDKRYQSTEEMLIDLRKVALTEDFLAPASDVARWVLDTFGRQLELRRQAAGIAPRTGQRDVSAPIAIPELGLGQRSAPRGDVSPDPAGETSPEDTMSRTAILRTEAEDSHHGSALPRKQKNILLGLAGTLAAAAVIAALASPHLLQGGFLDESGTYVEHVPVDAALDARPLEIDPPSTTKTSKTPKPNPATSKPEGEPPSAGAPDALDDSPATPANEGPAGASSDVRGPDDPAAPDPAPAETPSSSAGAEPSSDVRDDSTDDPPPRRRKRPRRRKPKPKPEPASPIPDEPLTPKPDPIGSDTSTVDPLSETPGS